MIQSIAKTVKKEMDKQGLKPQNFINKGVSYPLLKAVLQEGKYKGVNYSIFTLQKVLTILKVSEIKIGNTTIRV